MTIETLDLGRTLLYSAAVLLVAVLAIRVSSRVGLPSLLVYLGIGVLLGESGLIGIGFDDHDLARVLGFAALVLILTEGGYTTRWSQVRAAMPLGIALSTVGVAISAGLVGVFAHYVLGLEWRTALLLGAITASTDAAAVFSVLRRVPLRRRLSSTLEAESGLNDAPTVILVTVLVSAEATDTGLLTLTGQIAWQLVLGAIVGIGVGVAGGRLVRWIGLTTSAPAAVAVLGVALLSYGVADQLGASGFVAVYVAALILGNSGLPYPRATRSFTEGLAWFAQIGLFVMLGMLAWPGRLDWYVVGLAVAAGLMLTLLARPISVIVCATPFGMAWREQAFLGWTGLRGAVPIVLATIPLAAAGSVSRREDAELLFDVVFVLVVVFTLVQAPTLPLVARWLGVAQQDQVEELDIEVAPLEMLDADLLELRVGRRSRISGVEVGELRLPDGAWTTLVIREGRAVVPRPETILRYGDDVLVVAQRQVRDATEQRLREISSGGRLTRWRSIRPPGGGRRLGRRRGPGSHGRQV